jgi:WD40 repeat protein
MKDGRHVALAYEDGVVKVWDLKEGNPLISVAPPMGHSASVTSLAVHHEAVLLLSGSEDSTAKLINANSGKVRFTFDH